jgi:hypothetical protein
MHTDDFYSGPWILIYTILHKIQGDNRCIYIIITTINNYNQSNLKYFFDLFHNVVYLDHLRTVLWVATLQIFVESTVIAHKLIHKFLQNLLHDFSTREHLLALKAKLFHALVPREVEIWADIFYKFYIFYWFILLGAHNLLILTTTVFTDTCSIFMFLVRPTGWSSAVCFDKFYQLSKLISHKYIDEFVCIFIYLLLQLIEIIRKFALNANHASLVEICQHKVKNM